MLKKIVLALTLLMVTAMLFSCADDEYMPPKKVTYPDSVYGKAKFGQAKFN
jgi:hypothetical protein